MRPPTVKTDKDGTVTITATIPKMGKLTATISATNVRVLWSNAEGQPPVGLEAWSDA